MNIFNFTFIHKVSWTSPFKSSVVWVKTKNCIFFIIQFSLQLTHIIVFNIIFNIF